MFVELYIHIIFTVNKILKFINSKHDTEYKRTMPSVIDKIKNVDGGAKKVYRKMICSKVVDCNMQGVANPRNGKQVKNALHKKRTDQLLSRDDLYNLFQLSSHLDGFVRNVTLYPDLVAISQFARNHYSV